MLQSKNDNIYLIAENVLHLIVIHVRKAVMKCLEAQKYAHGYLFETDKGEMVEMIFMIDGVEDFFKWYNKMCTDDARIIRNERITSLIETTFASS